MIYFENFEFQFLANNEFSLHFLEELFIIF